MSDKIRINGKQLSWGSIIFKIDGDPWHGFTKLNYSHSREREFAFGMAHDRGPRGRSRGKYTPDNVTLGGPKGSMQDLRNYLMSQAADGKSYGDVEFEIFASWFEDDDTECDVLIEGCVIVKETASHEEGTDVLEEELEIQPLRVTINGGNLYSAQQQ